ncbi:methionyl-tRNA formyltransferase [Demequina zhanjiangensis]|uniref:Methionyl-tRNA formyltransferase n=1 Tax=Demequina zhanjiangensis TaxID=3051659 RepID=A0ABT8G2F8_9MICO|nr:methionyl-tRNA formyltransferase [Demequina sp. SYSU T00b26]MDN4473327.1 methionyl-tRNA formyltransferase [Demequina sp. SYSU T00b26]
MRVIFAGTPEVAVPSLEALLASDHEVVAVITQPDARGRRGKALHPSPVKEFALAQGLDVLTPEKASDPEFIAQVAALEADAGAVVAYGQILRPALLESTRLGWVNLHFSVLPAWRGAAPVQRSLMAGDDVTGATTFLLDKGMDTGPVLGLLTERIRVTDTAGDLLDRLAQAGAPLLAQTLSGMEAGVIVPEPQSVEDISYAPKLTRDDAYVRWERPAHVVDRQVRGCTPAPGAWTTLPDGQVAKLGPVSPRLHAPRTVPGQVREMDGEVLVGTGTEPVALSTIAPAGKRAMAAADWWRGARLSEGAALGEA